MIMLKGDNPLIIPPNSIPWRHCCSQFVVPADLILNAQVFSVASTFIHIGLIFFPGHTPQMSAFWPWIMSLLFKAPSPSSLPMGNSIHP